MPTPLTAPSKDSTQASKQYTRVHIIGDRLARDYEANELQAIQDQRRQAVSGAIFRHGAIVREAGGAVTPAQQGIKTADILAIAVAGPVHGYQIKHSQQYLLTVTTGGVPGTARILVTSNGPDNNNGAGHEIITGLGDPLTGSHWYRVGTEGVLVAFKRTPAAAFEAGDTWTIQTLHERQTPFVGIRGWITGDPGSGPNTEAIGLPQIDVAIQGEVFTVLGTTLLYEPATSGSTTIFVEALTYRVTADDDPVLADDLSSNPTAERLQMACAYSKVDTTGEALPAGAIGRIVVPVYVWDRSKSYLDPTVVKPALDFPYRLALDQLPGQLGPDSLVNIDLNQQLTGELARRDSEVFGSYVVSGLGVQQSTNAAPSGKIGIVVDAGVARVNGVRVEVPATSLLLDSGIEAGTVEDEVHVYDSGTTDYPLNKGLYVLPDGLPVSSITRLVASHVAATAGLTRSATEDVDSINDTVSELVQVTNARVLGATGVDIDLWGPALELDGALAPDATTINLVDGSSVYAGGGQLLLEQDVPGKEELVSYTGRTNNQLTGVTGVTYAHDSGSVAQQENFRRSGNGIQWRETNPNAAGGAFSGTHPDSGYGYTVAYHRSQQLAAGAGGDFQLIDLDGDGALDAVRFNASPPGIRPVTGTEFQVDYDFYLRRRDIVFLRQDGTIGVSRGTASEHPLVRSPGGAFMELATILVPPSTSPDALIVRETRVQAMTMRELCSLAKVVDDMRHDFTTQRHLNQILGLDPGFHVANADSFVSDAKVDWGFVDRPGGVGGEDEGVAITCDAGLNIMAEVETFVGGHLRLPRNVYDRPLTPNLTQVPANPMVALANWLCLPYTEVSLLAQTRWSERRNINSFLAYSPPSPRLILDPSEDFWIETSNLFEVVIGSLTYQLSQDTWTEANQTGRLPKSSPFNPGRRVRFDWLMQRIEEVSALYMRQIDVVVSGRHFVSAPPERITITFDGKDVLITPLEPISVPATTSMLVSGDEFEGGINPQLTRRGGNFKARFTIPAGVKTGLKEVCATGDQGSVAYATFTSFGIERTVHNLYTPTILRSPLAQTFAFVEDFMLTKAEVPFADKYVRVTQSEVGADGLDAQGRAVDDIKAEATLGPQNDPLVVEIREVAVPGGFPGPRFAEQVPKGWEDIAIDGTPTVFAFPDLVAQPAGTFLAICFRNQGNEYQVSTATMGRRDLSTDTDIVVNPNINPGSSQNYAGICLDSLNNLYWETPDPNAPGSTIALRWELFRAQFATGTDYFVYYDLVEFPEPVGFLFLVTQQFVPNETDLIWEVSTDAKATWREIVPFRELRLTVPAASVFVRARASSTVDRRSPMIAQANATLVGSMPKAVGEYIEKRTIASNLSSFDTDASPDDIVFTAKVYYELKPGTEDPRIFLSNGESSGELPIWEECGLVPEDVTSVALGDGWIAYTIDFTFTTVQNNTAKQNTNRIRSRIKMTGADESARMNGPEIREFGYSIKET